MPSPETSVKILIVEDEEALAKSMARILKSRGIVVDTAFSGAEARQSDFGGWGVMVSNAVFPFDAGGSCQWRLRRIDGATSRT